MNRVTGIGGIYFTCADPARTREWYKSHLGIDSGDDGRAFRWRDVDNPSKTGHTVWGLFPAGKKYFDPGSKSFMINCRVENLEELINTLQREGVTIVGSIEKYEYGKFGWIIDPDGNKIELWEPVDELLPHT